MSDKKFIAFLTEEDGRSRTVINGVVTSVNKPTPLPEMPIGNQEISIGWERSRDHGSMVQFGLPMGFVMTGAAILRNDFYKFTVDRKLDFVLKRFTSEFTNSTFREYYKQYCRVRLDMSTLEDNQGEHKVEVSMMQGGLYRTMKANETTKYDIPLDMDAKNIRMDGMYISADLKWTLPDSGGIGTAYVGMYQLPNDTPVPGLAIFDVFDEFHTGPPDGDSTQYFATVTQDIPGVRITGTIANLNQLGSAGPLDMRFYIWNTESDTLRETIDLTPADPYPENYNLVIDETIDLLKGDRLFFKRGSVFSESTFQMFAKSKPLPSTNSAFTLYDLGRKLVGKMTGNPDNFQSTFLQDKNILVTSVDGIRGITGASVKTSWQDYTRAVNAYFMTGVQITDREVRIESRFDFYDTTNPVIELGDVKNWKCTWATDLLCTSIKVGHKELAVDDTNGKFGFNDQYIFSTPIKGIPAKELDLTSPWKADPFEIEQTRANYEGKTTTDKSTDNDVVVIAGKPDLASNSVETTVTFQADGTPFVPGVPLISMTAQLPVLKPGMKIRVTGSASNDGEYTIQGQTSWFFGQLVTTNEPLIDEAGVVVTIEIIEGQYYTLDRDIPIQQLTLPDVSDDVKNSVYNVPLSPKRLLLNHARWLAGIFVGYESEFLKFETANRNKELIAGGLIEKADVLIADLGAPIFLPRYVEFESSTPVDMTESLELNPTPVFSHLWEGQEIKGFMYVAGIAATTLEEQNFKLLLTPDTNVLNLA